GDIFTSLYDLQLLDQLLDAGYRYLANSNSDNLGGAPSAELAGWFAQSGVSYAPEVCVRTAADRKGGHLAKRKSDGQVILRDTAQTPEADMHYFTDEFRHRFFHTNNLWFNIEALRDLLRATEGRVGLPLIRNKKNVDPADKSTPEVYQIESASGAIVERFSDSTPIAVPRSRFLPVKTTNDLFLLRSDAYDLTADSRIELNRDEAPLIDLDPKYFGLISDFAQRVPAVPSLAQVTSLKVNSDYTFTGTEKLSGDVELG
ncbi:MAG: UTP--glucose-1-phosphate uridylyltransferase, partial [Arcanobacterium sp.]|nr:UTP--glucose-1-phosphate uridylyltransferase [Arcanobacterium sp.]